MDQEQLRSTVNAWTTDVLAQEVEKVNSLCGGDVAAQLKTATVVMSQILCVRCQLYGHREANCWVNQQLYESSKRDPKTLASYYFYRSKKASEVRTLAKRARRAVEDEIDVLRDGLQN